MTFGEPTADVARAKIQAAISALEAERSANPVLVDQYISELNQYSTEIDQSEASEQSQKEEAKATTPTVSISENKTVEENPDGSRVETTTNSSNSAEQQVYYESDGTSSSGPEEDATNNNAGQRDYSENGDQVPSDPQYDQGEFAGLDKAIDDQKAMDAADQADMFYTGSSSRSASPNLFSKGESAKAEWKEAKDLRAILRVPLSYLTKNTDPGGVLKNFGGIVFPYTPAISFEHQASFSGINPTHSNYTQYFYKNSSVGTININAKFTVQNEEDGVILLGVIHLLRALTRMKFGPDKDSGAPPPVCRLQAYGDYMLQNVPVAVSSFRHELPDSVDYFAVGRKINTLGPNLVPVLSTINLTLTPMWSRSEQMASGVDNWLKGTDRAKGYL